MKTLTYGQASNLEKGWLLLFRLFLIMGIVIRLFHFFYNRSLWMDEVYLSASLIKYSYLELISGPLLYQQKAPIGFLLVVKTMVNLFGDDEFALRLIPLFSGLISMFVFIPVSKYFLSHRASVIAMGILCFSPALVYHSVEIKQYSTELLGAVLCLYLFIRFEQTGQLKTLILWGVFGALILWFSYSSIFILAGIALGRSLNYIVDKNWRLFFIGIVPYSIWFVSFLINYMLFTHKHAESEWIVYWFKSYDNFMPFPPKSLQDLKWFALNLYRMMDYPLGLLWNFNEIKYAKTLSIILKMPILPIGLLLAGTYTFCKGKKIISLILGFPILLTLVASGLELYPLTERFWVFMAPVFIIIIAKGFDLLIFKIKSQSLVQVLAILVLLAPIIQSAIFVVNPAKFYVHKKSFQRETLMYINDRYRKGDIVYVYWNNLPGYRIYKEMYHFNFTAVEGKDVRKQAKDFNDYYKRLKPDLDRLSENKRIWLVFNTKFLTDIGDRIDEPAWYYQKNNKPTNHLLKEFLKLGKPVDKKITTNVSVYLFECNH